MSRTSSVPKRTLVLILALVWAGACDKPPLPTDPTVPTDPTLPPDAAPPLPKAITCRVEVTEGVLTCHGQTDDPVPGLSRVIVGAQDTFVTLASDNVSYDGSSILQADITVQNLIAQPLGTTDGTTVDAQGVRVFFHRGPVVTSGSGTVTVANASGTATFIQTEQPYFQYDEMLDTDEISSPMTWQWNVESSVNAFEFDVYVAADVQHPEGWVTATPDAIVIPSGATQQVTAEVLDVVGREQASADKTYTTTDPNVVTVDAGVITAVNDGTASVIVASPPCTPATVNVVVTSDGVTRQWVGGDAAGPTDWGNATNWYPAGIPVVGDSVIIPTGATAMPVLGASTAVGRVEVEDQATLSLAGYTLTVWRDLWSTGQIVGPGLLTLAAGGGGWELAGSVPSVLVTGTYEAYGSVTVLGSLTVRGGYLSNRGFRLLVREPAP